MLRDSFKDEYPQAKKHKIVTGAPEDYRRWFILPVIIFLLMLYCIFESQYFFYNLELVALLAKSVHAFFIPWLSSLVVLAIGCAFYLYRRKQYRRLKILEVSERGVTLGRLKDQASEAVDFLITWKEITSVTETATSSAKQPSLTIKSKLNISFKLTHENAFGWVKREDLIDGLLRWAPQAELQMVLPLEQETSKQLSYTSLWLENFECTGRRKRLGPLEDGDKLNDNQYQVIRQIGEGGQGKAYVARVLDKTLPHSSVEEVILKEYVLPNMLSALRDLGRNYSDEAMILSKLDHPNIVKIFDSFEEDYRGYLVLEYVKGASMRTQVESSGLCPERFAIEIAMKLSEVLAYMHEQTPPIIHGDVTPENIMVHKGAIKLIDFTVAHPYRGERKTRLVGKRGYIAHEQFKGLTLPQSDLYSLGCTLYFILSGKEAEDTESLSLIDIGAPVSEGMSKIVSKCMQDNLENRYASANELRADLMQLKTLQANAIPEG